jgi:hypothetical protein
MTCVSSLYLPGLAEVCTPRSCSGGTPSQRSRSTRTRGACSEPDRTTRPSSASRSTVTSEPLTPENSASGSPASGADASTSSQAVSPARTSASQGAALGWTARGPDYGPSIGGSLKRSNRRSSSRRTPPTSPVEGSIEFCTTLPRSGSMRSGALYRRSRLELPTVETGFGSLLPTLTASSYGSTNNRRRPDGSEYRTKGKLSLQSMARRGALSALPLLPTLTVKGNYNKQGLAPRSGDGLATALQRIGHGGPLNPMWLEWFMGWPIGATGREPLETDKFRSWLLSQLASLRDVSASISGEL